MILLLLFHKDRYRHRYSWELNVVILLDHPAFLVGPIICRDDVYRNKIWCRVGKTLKLEDVKVEGEPPAKVTWHFKGVDQATLGADVKVINNNQF